MSIKTLRKRIALVAVSALGVGLLSVGPASAGELAAATYNWGSADATAYTSATAGFCSQNDTTDVLVVRYPSSTTSWALQPSAATEEIASTKYAFITASGGSGYFSTASEAATDDDEQVAKSGDERTLTIGNNAGGTALDVPEDMTWVVTGTGTVTFNLYEVVISTGVPTLLETYKLIVGANCDAAAAYSPTYSGSSLRTVSTALTASTYDDGDTSGAVSVEYATGVSYLGFWLRDAYGEAVSSTSSFLNVTATGGCTISATTTDLSSTSTSLVITSGITNAVVKVFTGGKAPNKCNLVATYNGTKVADHTVSFKGETATIATADVDAAITAASTVAMTWTASDSGKSQLGSIVGTAVDLTGSMVGASITVANTTSTAGANVTIDAVDTAYGKGTFRIRTTLADGSYVYSPVQNVLVTLGSIDKYTMSLDKASYGPGQIITVTISATDAYGSIVADGTTLAAGASGLSFTLAGATALTAAPAHGDTSTGGKWTYKYTAGTTEGDWAANLGLSGVTTDTAKQVTYVIKSTSTAVTNAEVLAAIVKLIASINKQIRALQKSLRR